MGKFCVDFHRIRSDLVLVDAASDLSYRYSRLSMPMMRKELHSFQITGGKSMVHSKIIIFRLANFRFES